MTKPSELAINIEAVKVGISQDKNGYYLRLGLHPQDPGVANLVTSPVGTRYIVAFVELNQQDEPVDKRDLKSVRSAAMFCRDPNFQGWLLDQGYAKAATEEEAISTLYAVCDIKSRSELATDEVARSKWQSLLREYMKGVRI